jgi:hypothetical protein
MAIRPEPFSIPERVAGELRVAQRPVRIWVWLRFPSTHGVTWIERQGTAIAWNNRFVSVQTMLPGQIETTVIVFASACRRFDAGEEFAKRRDEMQHNRYRPRRP